jgi:hypothetical protein
MDVQYIFIKTFYEFIWIRALHFTKDVSEYEKNTYSILVKAFCNLK